MQYPILHAAPIITDQVVILGILMTILGFVFYTAALQNKYVLGFFKVIPPLLLCYFLPGIFNSAGVFDGANSPLAQVGSRYLLPSCLILFLLNLDLKELWSLRKRAGIMFITGTIGIVLGGPIAVWITAMISPETVGGAGPDAVWRGLGTLAGSWIGGSANQLAVREIVQPSTKLFSAIIAVDVFVAYLWMALLLYGASRFEQVDRWFRADSADVALLTTKMQQKELKNKRSPEVKDFILMLSFALGGTGLATFLAEPIAEYIQIHHPSLANLSLTNTYFWIILFATLIGIGLSFTAARRLEFAGASKLATVLLYMLIVTIGMQMDILAISDNPGLFLVGFLWLFFHALLLFFVGRYFKIPFFYFALGSMANVGGVASASVTASAFHPSLISAAVLLCVFSYAIGTYAGWLTALLMQLASP
ncbi:DUF819 family protein [Sphingobacterium sp. lm-10]|uniref:DUF819 family protein n=1 Tax=Sphingobacterium sp. lm-10 TaxID=2944904 RepID=UPI0020219D68|nr:DUF819 family protein [Sphingobacterium sp. lm-10]MCL7987988.1 DUF819 family protein [Sphingobacterium sp. lm-10]